EARDVGERDDRAVGPLRVVGEQWDGVDAQPLVAAVAAADEQLLVVDGRPVAIARPPGCSQTVIGRPPACRGGNEASCGPRPASRAIPGVWTPAIVRAARLDARIVAVAAMTASPSVVASAAGPSRCDQASSVVGAR